MVHVLLVDVNVDTKGIPVVQVRNSKHGFIIVFSTCIYINNRCNRYGNNYLLCDHIMETKVFNDNERNIF